MTDQARQHALTAAQTASEGMGALAAYGRDGGLVGDSLHYDMAYPLAKGLFLALTATIHGGRAPDDDDRQLMAALSKWIEA